MKVGLSRAKSPDKFDFVLVTYLILMIGMSLLLQHGQLFSEFLLRFEPSD